MCWSISISRNIISAESKMTLCIYVYAFLSIANIYLSVCLYFYLSISVVNHLYYTIYLSVLISIYLYLSFYLSIKLSFHIHTYVCVRVCVHIYVERKIDGNISCTWPLLGFSQINWFPLLVKYYMYLPSVEGGQIKFYFLSPKNGIESKCFSFAFTLSP